MNEPNQRRICWKVEAWDRPDWKPLVPGWKLIRDKELPSLMVGDYIWHEGLYEKIEDKNGQG